MSAVPIEGKKKKVKKKRDTTEAALLLQAPVLINHIISHETFHFSLSTLSISRELFYYSRDHVTLYVKSTNH